MKFFQVHTFCQSYLSQFYARRPELTDAPLKEIQRSLVADACEAPQMWAPMLGKLGQQSQFAIANDIVSQSRWVSEKAEKFKPKDESEWVREITAEQINRFKPDVLHLGDPVTFDMAFVRKLKRRPRWVIGWNATPPSEKVDWKGMDLLLSPVEEGIRFAWKQGVNDARPFHSGFGRWVAEDVFQEPKEYDVVISGRWSDRHQHQNNLITTLAKASLSSVRPFRFGVFLECDDPLKLPDVVRKLNQGSRWGLDLYRSLRSGHVVVNAETDGAGGSAWNGRIFEATGVGSCILTELRDGVDRFFVPGKEIVTFKGGDDCLAKLLNLLDHPDNINSIAKAGQERCLTEHESGVRMKALLELLERKPNTLQSWIRRTSQRFASR